MISEILIRHPWLWPLVWQSTLCLAAGLAGSFLLRKHAARAHQALLMGLIAAMLIPAVSEVVKRNQWGLFVAEQTVPLSPSPRFFEPVSLPVSEPPMDLEPMELPRPVASPAIPPPAAPRFEWTRAILPVWLVVSSVLLLRLAFQFLLGLRLARHCEIIEDGHIPDMLDQAKSRLGVRAKIDVRGGEGIRSPAIWCWSRTPTLLVPGGAGQTTDHLDWLGITCHELAHAKRRDHIAGLIAELMVCVLPWHPLVWWTRHRLASLSEEACDDWVIASGQRATGYARTLLDLTPQAQAALIPGVVTTRRGLSARIHRILENHCADPRLGTRWMIASMVMSLCFTLGIAFTQTRDRIVTHDAAEAPSPVDTGTNGADRRMTEIVQVYVKQLRYADALEVARAINQLFGRVNEPNGPGGTVGRMLPASASQVVASADSRTNSVVFTGPKAVLDAITAVVKNRDQQFPHDPNGVDVETFHLEYADARNTASLVNTVFAKNSTPGRFISRAGAISDGRVVASADTRTNSIVVSGLPDMMAIVAYIIGKLDQKPEQEGRVFVYSPKNGAESNLATALNDLFTQVRSFNRQGDSRAATSLVGNRMPSLEGLGLNVRVDDLKDRRILVCFFDMEARPFLQAVQGLIGQAAWLKERGVSVLAVQDKGVHTVTLRDLLGSQPPFPVGRITADPNEVKFAWSVRSLPWLVLTDKDHVVVAEGFSIDELDSLLGVENPAKVQTKEPRYADASDVMTFHLWHVDALNTAALVNEVFGNGRTSRGSSSSDGTISEASIVATADIRTNSVVVSGPPDRMATLVSLMKELDQNSEQERRLFRYPLKNAKASDLATSLNKLVTPRRTSNARDAQMAQAKASDASSGPSEPNGASDWPSGTAFVADPRMNWLLVLTSAKNYLLIKPIINNLDSKAGEASVTQQEPSRTE